MVRQRETLDSLFGNQRLPHWLQNTNAPPSPCATRPSTPMRRHDNAVACRTRDARYQLLIDGMTCSACSTRLERMLSAASGIATAAVNLATERATVDIDDGTSLDSVIQVVRRAGFDARKETRAYRVSGASDGARRPE